MTELVCDFLDGDPRASVRCILHIDAAPLLGRGYKASHLLRRFQTMAEIAARHHKSIQIAHEGTPSNLNHMIFDDQCELLGFKRQDRLGIDRTVLSRSRSVVRSQAEVFDQDFEHIAAANKKMAAARGIDITKDGWHGQLIQELLALQIRSLSGLTSTVAQISEPFARVESSEVLAQAIEFATRKHAEFGQTREDRVTPYSIHVLRVVERLRTVGRVDDYAVLAAAALHDVVEDCDVDPAYLSETFGKRISDLVVQVTKVPGQSSVDFLARTGSRQSRC